MTDRNAINDGIGFSERALGDSAFSERVAAQGVDPVEAHATLAGFLCAGGDADVLEDPELDMLLPDVDGAFARRLIDAVVTTLRSLDYEFRPLIGDDDVPLADRLESLTRWCSAFMGGFGMVDAPAFAHEDCRELLTDLAEIAGGAIADDDEEAADEAAFEEVYEFVRVAALTLYNHAEERRHVADA